MIIQEESFEKHAEKLPVTLFCKKTEPQSFKTFPEFGLENDNL